MEEPKTARRACHNEVTRPPCLINKYGLDATDLLVVRTILIYQEEQSNILFNLISALKQCKIDFREILVKLQSKGIITKEYKIPNKGETFNPLDIAINKNVIKTIYKGSFELGKELFEVYPQFGNINGCVVPLRTVAKKFDSLEDCYARYGKEIKWNPEIHSTIIDLVKWAKDNNILNCSLASFIINNGWNDLQALKDGEGNINYDAIKLV